MPRLDLGLDWRMEVTTREFLLILKALGGRLKDEDLHEARALGDTLTRLRGTITKQSLKTADRLINAVGPASEENET